jgi:hypothetical protein
MFNQKVFTLLGMWLNGRVLPCHAQGPGFNTRAQRKEKGKKRRRRKRRKVKNILPGFTYKPHQ